MLQPTRFLAIGLMLLCQPSWSANEGFAGGVTPSRFELAAKQGELVRRSFKLYNLSARPQQFNVRTADWQFSPEGQISFQQTLAADSCREWVRLERHKISVIPDPQQPRNFRFEMQIPADAEPQQCRFALMIESTAEAVDTRFADGALNLPITGRIAVIVYLNVGDVEAELQFGTLAVRSIDVGRVPTVEVHNSGAAHGRLDADLVAVQADGSKVRLSIDTTPILPHQTRYLALMAEDGKPLQYPLRVTGEIYSDDAAYAVEQELETLEPKFIARD